MSYYDNSQPGQWPPAPNHAAPPQATGWDHQTPPVRSGASSAVPKEEPVAFVYQIEEVDRAIDNLMKSGKMFNMGGRMGRNTPGVGGPRPQSMAEISEARHNPQTNLQNYYASQRHQSSRGSNEAESMFQAKRRMAAARERDLRNYHQEQQYNRTVHSEVPGFPAAKNARTLSPGGMTEEERRHLIARQRSALYGEGPFAETGGYVDETGAPRPGIPGPPGPATASLRGPSPLAYEFNRGPHGDNTSVGTDPNHTGAPRQPSRANSTSSPHSNAPSNKGVFENSQPAQQSSRTSNSSPDGSPSHQGAPIGTKPSQTGPTVAPIGTRPGGSSGVTNQAGVNPAMNKMATPPLISPLNRAPGGGEDSTPTNSTAPSNPTSAATEGPIGLGGWGGRGGVWGNKSGLQPNTSVWV